MARYKTLTIALALALNAAATPVQAQTAPAQPEQAPDPPLTPQQVQSKRLAEQAATAYNAGRYAQALGLFNEAVRLDPDGTHLLSMRGETYVQLGRCEEAIADFDAYEEVMIFSEFLYYANVFSNRGYCHMELKNYEAAADDLWQQAIYKPDDDWAWSALGRASTFLNRHEEAETAFLKAIELKPDDSFAYYHLALEYIGTNRLHEARQHLQTTLRLEPGNKEAADLLVLLEQELAKQSAASAPAAPAARPATSAPPSAPVATAARPATAAPVAAGPRAYPQVDARSPLGRGLRLFHEGELQQSLPFLEEATRLDPQDARGFAFLTKAYYMLGLQRESDAARARALALDPGIMAMVP